MYVMPMGTGKVHLSGWIQKLHPHAIRPIQQFAYTTGKNATDSAMIIDAMDLLYSNTVDAYALMTSDSDFTPLVCEFSKVACPSTGLVRRKHHCPSFMPVHSLSTQKICKLSRRALRKFCSGHQAIS